MDLVKQEHVDGCGVACFAMLTGRTYAEALARLNPNEESWTNTDDLLKALDCEGLTHEIRIRPDIRTLRTSILTVWYKIGEETYLHTVVWDAEKQQVLDPWGQRPFDEYVSGLCLAFELN